MVKRFPKVAVIDVDGPQGEKLISSIARSFPFPPGELLIKTTSTSDEEGSDLKSVEKFFHTSPFSSFKSPVENDFIILQ